MELPYPAEEHQARLMCGDPVALAYEWLKGYAENLNSQMETSSYGEDYAPITVEELIETGMSHVGDGWGDYISRGGSFEGVSLDMTFWDKLSIFKQIEIPQDNRNSFLSCSC